MGFYAKLQKFTARWERDADNNLPDCTAASTYLLLGARRYPEPSLALYTGFMHGFFHSLRISSQSVSVESLAIDFTNECNGYCDFCSTRDQSCHDSGTDSDEQWVAKMDFGDIIDGNTINDISGSFSELVLDTTNPPILYVNYLA